MYTVTIYDKSKRKFKSYHHIFSIEYLTLYDEEWVTVSGEAILSHPFPTNAGYRLMSDAGNYSIESSLVNSIEIEKES